jgi:acetyl-CoA synthetase
MLERSDSYENLIRSFEWSIPGQYNIATDACEVWAKQEPDRVALIFRDLSGKDVSWTYGALNRAANRLANVLAAGGVGRGDRVAILLPQSPEVVITHLATYKLGAIALPLSVLFGVDGLLYRLSDAGARAVVTNAGGLERLADIRLELESLKLILSVDGRGPLGAKDFHAMLDRASDQFATAITKPFDPALMIYTSGTTGPPKGALHGHRVLPGHLPGIQFAHEFMPEPGDIAWTPADWAWAGGLLNLLLPALKLGVPVVAGRFDKFDPEAAFGLIATYRVRNAFIPPTALRLMRLVDNPRARFDLNLRTIGSAGEALGSDTFEWARSSLGLTINEFYGQTECNAVIGSCNALGVARAGAIGRATPGHDVAIVDQDGNVLPYGRLGQIAIRSPDPVMFLEYWNKPQATVEKFVGDWMVTGDVGIMSEDGYISFVGRDDDVITSSGYRIGPAEIEDCLASHPAVTLAAVVGKPDRLRTELVTAYVKLADGVKPTADLKATLSHHVRNRLSAHEYPREVHFVDEIPLTTSGKVIRRFFRERARADAAAEEAAKNWD